MVSSFKEVFEFSIKCSEYRNHICLPYGDGEEKYYENRVKEIGQLMSKLHS